MTLENIVAGIGIAFFIFGGCGLDSQKMLIPVVMTLIGLALVLAGTREDRSSGNCYGQKTY